MPDQAIVVLPYDPDRPARFEAERRLLERVLAPWLEGGVHHVGSTAVPGLAAKPLIDMIAGVRNFEEARAAYAPLAGESYVHTPHRPGVAHHFSKPSARLSETRYGLHLTEPGSDLWVERLTFRNALRADASLTADYEALKLAQAKEHGADVAAYTDGKRNFVISVLAAGGVEPGRR